MLELVLVGEIGVERAFATFCLGQHRRQPVIALRADHHVHERLTPNDFRALGLCHTTRHADLQIRFFRLEPLVATQLGIDLFRRLFADVTGVENDHVRVFGRVGRDIAFARQRL